MGLLLRLPFRLYQRGEAFIGDIVSELKKVVWPTRREALYLTTVVVIVAAAVGIILGVVDYIFARLADVLVFR